MKRNVAGDEHRVRLLSSDFSRQPLPRPGIRGPRIRGVREAHVSVNQNAQFLLRANSRDDEGRLVRMIERADLRVPRHTKRQTRCEHRQRKWYGLQPSRPRKRPAHMPPQTKWTTSNRSPPRTRVAAQSL